MPRPDPEPYSDFVPAYPALGTLSIGETLLDKDNNLWVFIGWRRNTARYEGVFVQAYLSTESYGMWKPSTVEPWIYHASGYDALVRKFPRLKGLCEELTDV